MPEAALTHLPNPQMHLALYCFASSQLSTALSLLYRARYLMLLVFGEDHPEMALLDVSVGEESAGEQTVGGVCAAFGGFIPSLSSRTTLGWCSMA